MNYLRVRKNKIGKTEKFWNNIPAWTTLPMMKKTIYYAPYLLSKQSKIVEYPYIYAYFGEQVRPPIKPTKKYTAAVNI